jgi:Protein of unknown function (DUF3574)
MIAMRRPAKIPSIPIPPMTAALLGCVLAVAGCAAPGDVLCSPAETARGCALTTELFLGQTRPDGSLILAAEWDAFLREIVTPLFPAGLTVVEGSGQWRGGDGKIGREPAKILIIVRPGGADGEGIVAVIAAYKTRFAQESVLRVDLKSAAWF